MTSSQETDATAPPKLDAAARQAQERQVLALLSNALEPAAFSRLMNIRLSSPDSFARLATAVIRAAQTQPEFKKVTDDQLRTLASRLNAARPQPTIKIRRK